MVEEAFGEKHLRRKKRQLETIKAIPHPPQQKTKMLELKNKKGMDLGLHFGYWESQVKVQGPNIYPILGREKIL
jgi:hypothetical protein